MKRPLGLAVALATLGLFAVLHAGGPTQAQDAAPQGPDAAPKGPGAAPQGQAAAPLPLRYRFDRLAGRTAIYTVETELSQSVDHDGRARAQGLRWRRDTFEQRYQRKGQGGRIKQKRTRVEMRVEAPGQAPVTYDSKSDDEPPEGLNVGVARVGRTVIIDMNHRGEVSKVRGASNAVERNGYAASFLRMPEKPLAVGGTWRRPASQRVPYPPFGTLVYHTRYTLQEVKTDGSYLVSATIDILYERPPPDPNAPEPPAVKITTQKAGGTLLFRADGLLLESQFRSELAISINDGQKTRIEKASSTTVQRLQEERTKKTRKKTRKKKSGS